MSKVMAASRSLRQQQEDGSSPKLTDFEQKRFEAFVEDGTIHINDTGAHARTCDALFSRYSNNVVGHYLGLLRKKKLGARSKPGPVQDVLTQCGVVPPSSSSRLEKNLEEETDDFQLVESLICSNAQFLRFNYMDYESKQEKIIVLVDLPGGSGQFDWEFNELGDKITVYVNWSDALCDDVSKLFTATLNAKTVTLDHPKLHAMQDELVKSGISLKHIPRCSFQIFLGKRVHKDDDTWNVNTFQHDGNKILMLEFSGFQEEVLKKIKCGSFGNI